MNSNTLTLIPYGRTPFTVQLTDNFRGYAGVESIMEQSSEAHSVFSDLSYEMELKLNQPERVRSVSVHINDVPEPSVYRGGRLSFPDKNACGRRIFLDCYGFVELGFVIEYEDGEKINLYSEYLPVLVRKGELNDSVKAMVDYVYKRRELLLLEGEPKPKNLADLKENGFKSLGAQILLAEETAAIYEMEYGYFKANSRFRIEKAETVDSMERVKYITSSTLSYTASHPELLREVSGSTGVRISGRTYQPIKTMTLQNRETHDTYENRVLICFLLNMTNEMEMLRLKCSKMMESLPKTERLSDGYVFSPYFMFSETRKSLSRSEEKLEALHDRFAVLLNIYVEALGIKPAALESAPHPTPVFMSVPQYNKIFMRIHSWFSHGVYDFSQERFMLSFIKISALFENYLLVRQIDALSNMGYELVKTFRCAYPVSARWLYRNTACANTFVFSDGINRVTLYFQPVIFDTDRSAVNGVGLYRNNSIPVYTEENDDVRNGGHYYVPDYLIKAETSAGVKYLIADAKFSDFNNVRRHCIKDLAFKYLFSLSPVNAADIVAGMCVMYGKCTPDERVRSAYDRMLVGGDISPFVYIVPMSETLAGGGAARNAEWLLRRFFNTNDDR